MKKIFFSLILFTFFLNTNQIVSQNKLNNYEYILIPSKFSFQYEHNELNINQILKATFNKYKFKAFVRGETMPNSIDPCSILNLDIEKHSFLSVKMNFIFYDCYGQKIYTSKEGISRIKERNPSILESVGQVFKDTSISNHEYSPLVVTEQNKKIENKIIEQDKSKISFYLLLRNKKYQFKEVNNSIYKIYLDEKVLGEAKLTKGTKTYNIDAQHLSGEGFFDDFGNFNITRKNPINNKTIKDIMERIN